MLLCFRIDPNGSPPPDEPNECRDGFTQFGTGCYQVVDRPYIFSEAQDECRSLGDDVSLGSVMSWYEEAFAETMSHTTGGDPLWIGLYQVSMRCMCTLCFCQKTTHSFDFFMKHQRTSFSLRSLWAPSFAIYPRHQKRQSFSCVFQLPHLMIFNVSATRTKKGRQWKKMFLLFQIVLYQKDMFSLTL